MERYGILTLPWLDQSHTAISFWKKIIPILLQGQYGKGAYIAPSPPELLAGFGRGGREEERIHG